MSDFSGFDKPKIAKLTGPNYRPWALQTKRFLQAIGLWEVVEQGPSVPVATVSAETMATGSTGSTGGPAGDNQGPTSPKEGALTGASGVRTAQNDAKATTLIIGLCASTVLDEVLLLETAKE
jgi:hypothetical protein